MSKLEIKNLTLIFGVNKKLAMRLLAQGRSKEHILQEAKCAVAVNNVSLSVNEGEIFVIMGLSGSGKSSLLRCLNLLNVPTAGSIIVDDVDITKMDKAQLLNLRRQEIGMVFQHFGLLPHKTILDNVAFGLEIQGMPIKDRQSKAEEIIDMVGLKGYENSYPHQLSGGMQQRVGIARAIATDSNILLMDEAFSALDPLIRSQMQDELIEIQQKLKKTIIFITHDLDEALKLGNTIAIMKDGEIVQQGTSEDILLNPADDYVRAFVENVDMSKIITAASIMTPYKAKIQRGKDGPAAALRQMERNFLRVLPVVDNANRFLGYVQAKDIRKALENNQHDLNSLLIEVPKITADTQISESLCLFIDLKYPLAVVDDKDRPLGYLRYSDVAEVMMGNDNGSDTPVDQEEK